MRIPFVFGLFGPRIDHDELILLKQRLELREGQVERVIAELTRHVTGIETRLEVGNKQFRDLDLFKQRIDEALVEVRDRATAGRLAADNAGRAADAVARLLDSRFESFDRQRLKDREEVAQLREDMTGIVEAVKELRTDVRTMKTVTDTWTVQGTLLQRMLKPGWTILLSVLTAALIAYFLGN